MKKYYHGAAKHGPYFEGWYLKLQTNDHKSLALIPAVHIGSTNQLHASLQVITNDAAWWLEYPCTEFHASETLFQIHLSKNTFNEKGIWLNVNQNGLSLHGMVQFGPFTPLKSDIMGPFRFVPGMECSHGVISMGHSLEGALILNGENRDFSGGMGYAETDRGSSFPNAYLWTQCIWQEAKCNSLMLSIAAIPLLGGHFTGCICTILHDGKEYRLATYRGARAERWSKNGALVHQGNYRLSVELLAGHRFPLRAPEKGNMSRTIYERLCCKVRYRFWCGDRLLFDHIDDCASFEYADTCSDL